MGVRWGCAAALAVALAACGASGRSQSGIALPDGGAGGSTGPDAGMPDAGVALQPPVVKDHWTFYGPEQGLSPNVNDVSPDEGGNVYVAGGDAVYAKGKADTAFTRFDAETGGLTKNCYDVGMPPDPANPAFVSFILLATHPDPPGPAELCPVITVAGGAPGQAAIGFQGLGTDGDYDSDWATDAGGADVLAFDASRRTLQRTRHVYFATPPHFICGAPGVVEQFGGSCPDATEPNWARGRRKTRNVFRMVYDHDKSSPMYGDLFVGGTHATLSALINPQTAMSRGWQDITVGQTDPKWKDAQFTWEHDHPAILGTQGQFLTGYTYAISIDPRTGTPWASNGFRTGFLRTYGADVSGREWFFGPPGPKPYYDLWPDGTADPEGAVDDTVQSMSHCADGTLWIGSISHGLARIDPGGGVEYGPSLPGGDTVMSVACDWSDGSVWVGLGAGGLVRIRGGQVAPVDTSGVPAFATGIAYSIQIDRWSTPRVVYVAYQPRTDHATGRQAPGGVAAYDGP